MSFAENRDVRLYYEAFGRKGDPALLLINGAGRQGVDFGEAFCGRLAAAGLRVIRFDSRDTGLSTVMSGRPARLLEVYDAVLAGRPPPLAYGLDALADDAFAVLDAEGEATAHILGRSLGSGVAQQMALAGRERIGSLTLIMAFSRSLADAFPRSRLEALEADVISNVEAYVARQVRVAQASGSPAYFDAERVAVEARRAYERGVSADGIARHFAAGIGASDLRPELAQLGLPTLVVHGLLDRIIPADYARETAAAIPGARLELLADMAHDGPPQLQDRWAHLMLEHIAAAR